MKRIKKTEQIGFTIGGEATLIDWGGNQGTIEMEKYFLPYEKTTPKNILRCVNDNGFGCQGIIEADIDIFITYSDQSKEYDRTIHAGEYFSKHFLGWAKLKEQGIKI